MKKLTALLILNMFCMVFVNYLYIETVFSLSDYEIVKISEEVFQMYDDDIEGGAIYAYGMK